jgi:hypothetical protein
MPRKLVTKQAPELSEFNMAVAIWKLNLTVFCTKRLSWIMVMKWLPVRGGRADVARVSEGNSSLRHVLSLVLLAIHVR